MLPVFINTFGAAAELLENKNDRFRTEIKKLHFPGGRANSNHFPFSWGNIGEGHPEACALRAQYAINITSSLPEQPILPLLGPT